MMNSPAHDIGLYLAANGIGAFGGTDQWAVNAYVEAVAPADTITLYDTDGGAPFVEIDLREPTFLVRVRSLDAPAGRTKAEAIFELLTRETTRVIGAFRFIGIWATSDIFSLGRDENDRHLFTMNFRTLRQPA